MYNVIKIKREGNLKIGRVKIKCRSGAANPRRKGDNRKMIEIMLSIRPKWCELIASGRKTIEVRKTKPKCDVPFKVYVYCTEDFRTSTKFRNHKFWIGEPINDVSDGRYLGNGKVIGEFICDKMIFAYIDDFDYHNYDISDDDLRETCLSQSMLFDYAKGKPVYGWHISDLIIYDKPKDLSNFDVKRSPQSWCYT